MSITRPVLGLAAALGVALLVAARPAETRQPSAPNWQSFQAVTPTAGWVLLDQRLYWTEDSGAAWANITPPGMGAAALQAAWFVDAKTGWLVAVSGTPPADPAYQLFTTGDGGLNWQAAPLDLFAPGDPAALAAAVYLELLDARTGWLVVRQATGSAHDLGTLFRTSDGGQSWMRLTLPLGAPVHFTSAAEGWTASERGSGEVYVTHDGGRTWAPAEGGQAQSTLLGGPGLTDLSAATASAGWARSTTGECDAGACTLTTQLVRTADGGQTWTAMPLPGGQLALTQAFAVPANPAGGGAAAQAAGDLTLTFNGQAFDGCFVDAGGNPLGNMQAWWNTGPYKARNLYLGGSGGAACTPLTEPYVQALAQQGWTFIPTWVGPQSACYAGPKDKMSLDPAVAYQQGRIEGFVALDRAIALGLAQPDGAGTVLYYDLESYPNNAACRESAKAFINGWTDVVNAAGSLAGVYGSSCSSYLEDFVGIPNIPDAVWIAYWTVPYQYNPGASVWGIPCISDGVWVNSQRLRQYSGGHNETWGGVTLNIDSNVLAGPVSTVLGDCAPGPLQVALFVYPNYGGQCAVRGLGTYPTAASLGVPNDSISSVRVGPGAAVRLCADEALGGACADVGADAPTLTVFGIGEDQASSALVTSPTITFTDHIYLPLITRGASLSAGQTARRAELAAAGPVTPTHWAYLPLVAKQEAPAGLLPNGGFEDGPVTWGLSSTHGRDLIVTTASLTATGHTTHSGQWAAWLGGVFTETAAMAQTVLVPPGAPYLAYWQWVDSAETGCHYDIASIWVNGNVEDAYGLCAALETNAWTRRTVDLSAFAGQSINLRLQVTTDSNLNSSLYLDDVAFEAGP